MWNIFNLLKKKSTEPIAEQDYEYIIEFRVSFPVNNDNYSETAPIRVQIKATSPKEAKAKFLEWASKKVRFTVKDINFKG